MRESVFQEGKVTLMYAEMGAGKTNLQLIYLHDAQKNLGYNVMANIPSSNKNIRLIGSDIQMLDYFLEKRERIVLAIDEANIVQTSKRATSQEAINIEAMGSVVRKFRMSWFYIIQRHKNLIPWLREMCYAEIYKTTKDTAKIMLPGTEPMELFNIPKCSDFGIEYDTYTFAGLKFYLDLPKLIESISSMSYDESIKKLEGYSKNGYADFLRDKPKVAKSKKKAT